LFDFSVFYTFFFFYERFFFFLNIPGFFLSNFAVSVIGMHRPLARCAARLDDRKMYVLDY